MAVQICQGRAVGMAPGSRSAESLEAQGDQERVSSVIRRSAKARLDPFQVS